MDPFDTLSFIYQVFKFLFYLPKHIYHTVTMGKYAETEAEQATYKTVSILLIVFSILGVLVYGMLELGLYLKG